MTAPAPESDRTRVDLLLADYQAAREDERSFIATMAAGIGVAVALLALLAAAVSQTSVCAPGRNTNCVPGLLLALAPLGPAAVGAFLATFGAAGTIRSYYLRALEAELRTYATAPFAGYAAIGPLTYISLVTEVTSLRRGRLGHRLLTNFIFLVVLVIFGGLALFIAAEVSPAVRVVMAAVYLPFALLLFGEVASVTLGGESLFREAARRFTAATSRRRDLRLDAPEPAERSLLSYLIWPRPEDWAKWMVAPGAYLLVAWASGQFGRASGFVVTWVVLEYLLYQARYQWNDVRGLEEDQRHAERRARARLPQEANVRRNVVVSTVVALARLATAGLAGWLFGLPGTVALLAVLVFGIAAGYEWLRSASRRAASRRRRAMAVVAIWLTVGIGYAVRAGVGFGFGGIALTSPVGLAGLLCFAAFGVMFVLLTWALEAAAHAERHASGALRAKPELAAKPHLDALLRFIGPVDPAPAYRDVAVLKPRGRIIAPWNIALVVAGGAAGLLGFGLAGGTVPADIAVALGAGGGVMLAVAHSTSVRLVMTAIVGFAIDAVGVAAGTNRPGLDATPWLLIAVWYVGFRASSYAELKHAAENIANALSRLGASVLKLIVGPDTWRWARFDEATKPR